MRFTTLIASSLVLAATGAHARGTATPSMDAIHPATPEELHNLASTSGCSAGYVDVGRARSAKAVVVTNGHCASNLLEARMAMVNQPANKAFNIFTADGGAVSVTGTRLMYATLMDTDIALYELRETNAELEARGLRPFPFYSGEAPVGSTVRVTSGYWRETQRCALERRVHRIVEGFGTDISDPSIATRAFALSRDCTIRGGYSGTPIIDDATDTVIAMAFTGAEGNRACAESSPCEEAPNGRRTYRRGTSYAARVDQLADCLQDGEINLALPTCTLFR